MTAGTTPPLHLVTDDRILGSDDFIRRAGAVMEAVGPGGAIHLRGPTTPAATLQRLAADLRVRAETSGTELWVNDRVDVAMAVGADGVQLGARSLPVATARTLVGSSMRVGRSVHGVEEAVAAEGEGAGLLLIGTIYATPSHPGRAGAGPARIVRIFRETEGPLIAIGGVTLERLPELRDAGASGVAVLRAVWDAEDPPGAALALLERWTHLAGTETR